jgi:hypothetical protein
MQKVTELFVWLALFPDRESVLRRSTPIGTQPLIADDHARAVVGPLCLEAQRAGVALGVSIKCKRFVRENDVLVLSAEDLIAGKRAGKLDEPPMPAQDAEYVRHLGAMIGRTIAQECYTAGANDNPQNSWSG